jgi:hypothetical protein
MKPHVADRVETANTLMLGIEAKTIMALNRATILPTVILICMGK